MRFFNRKKHMNGVEQRVSNGMALLDKNRPGWDRRINVHRLDIASPNDCALGQTYGWYGGGRDRLGLKRGESSQYGFNATMAMPWVNIEAEYEALTAEWRRQIQARRVTEKPIERKRVLARW